MTSYIIPKDFVLANCALNTRDTFKGRCSLFLAFKFKDHAVRSDPNNVANDFLHHSYKLCFSKLCYNARDTFKGRCSLFWPLILKAMLSGVIQEKLQITSYIIPKNFVLANCALTPTLFYIGVPPGLRLRLNFR